MAIPSFKLFILPVLKLTVDGAEHTVTEAHDSLARLFKATEEELKELLSSGIQTRFYNRVQWARTYLVKSGLLDATGRGRFRITSRGREVLADPPEVINKAYLAKFTEFKQFMTVTPNSDETPQEVETPDLTPTELLERSYQSLRQSLAAELLHQIKGATPGFFEKVVVDLLVKMGYGGSRKDAGQAVGKSGDEGIDGVIKEDRLGLDVVLLQAKRWEKPVGRPDVQTFVGSLDGQRARKGVFITTSVFTEEARQYVRMTEKKVVLIDGQQLAQFMIDFDVGVTEQTAYRIKRLDADYFDEGA